MAYPIRCSCKRNLTDHDPCAWTKPQKHFRIMRKNVRCPRRFSKPPLQDDSYARNLITAGRLRPIPFQLSNTCFGKLPNMMVFAIKSEKCRSNSESPRLGKLGAPNLSQKPRNSLKKERMSHISRILCAAIFQSRRGDHSSRP